jgi:SAM-dependent methyltransferase
MTDPFTGVAEIDALFADGPLLSRIKAEALFGYREISDQIAILPDGARVLEVGSGTGYLLAALARQHPTLHFEGLEPVGSGFHQFEKTLNRIEAATGNLTVHRTGIEEHLGDDGPGFDLVFSVNVFEHLPDWRVGLDRMMGLLSSSGSCVILCPNYAFPYEPHFGIPLLGRPGPTRRVFAGRIEAIEARTGSEGLWASLNFVTIPEVTQHARKAGYSVTFDQSILARMFERIDSDADFAERQRLLAPFVSAVNRIGLTAGLARLPAAMQPYMKATLTNPVAA